MPRKKKQTVDEKITEALDLADGTEIVKAEPVEGEVIDLSKKEIVPTAGNSLALGFPSAGENPEIDADYKAARDILENTGKQATEALEQMKEVAEQGQNARQYEVVGQLIKANLETAKAKIDLHKDMKSLRDQEGGPSQRAGHIGDVNQSILVGTTKELLDLHKSGKLPKPPEKPENDDDE